MTRYEQLNDELIAIKNKLEVAIDPTEVDMLDVMMQAKMKELKAEGGVK